MAMPLAHYRFTVDDYHRMADAGILTEDDRVELLDGQIVPMSPIGARHAGCVNHLAAVLSRRLGDFVVLAVQNPVILNPHWEPQPDIAVLRPRPDAYRTAHPRPDDVLLVVEVGDTSAAHDRATKLPGYAAARVPEVWLVDLEADRIEVYRSPTPRGYQNIGTVTRHETVAALLVPTGEIAAGEILG
jgi:Uma2 family endonuclease